jgi:hypothetical protein
VTLDEFLTRLDGVAGVPGAHRAVCPAHDDLAPSLSIGEGSDGRILVKCHAGCTTEDVLGALGLTWGDLWPPIAYPYYDAGGALRYVVRREDTPTGKRISQHHVAPDGTLATGLPRHVERLPYNLPAVLDAVRDGVPVYVVEGEKCAEALERLGLVATCNPGGAGKWPAGFERYFDGAHVVILPDNDDTGREHAARVAAALELAVASLRIVELPGLPAKGDIADWLEHDGTRERLDQIVADTLEPTDPELERFVGKFLDVATLETMPPPAWTIDGILQEAPISLLYGDGASYKSFLALDWALHMARGARRPVEWYGHAVKAERTLYVAAEGTGGLPARVRAWLARHESTAGEVADFILYPGAVSLLDAADVRRLVKACRRYGFTRLIVDTLRRSMPGAEENSAKDVGLVISNLGRIYEDAGVRSLVIHHANKGGGYRGSTVAYDDADNVLKMERDKETPEKALEATLKAEKTKDGAEFEPLVVRLGEAAGGSLAIVNVAGQRDVDEDGTVRAVLDAVGEAGERGISATALADEVARRGFPRDAARRAVLRAAEAGLLERTGDRQPWHLTPAARWSRKR